MEQEEPFRQFLSDALEKEFPQAEVHNNWNDFQDLCIQVVTVIVTVLEGILSRRNKWFQQTGLSATDIIYVLDMKKESAVEHFRTSVGSAVVNVFRQYDTRQRDATFGIFNVDGFHQQLWESLDLVIEDILIRNEWVELELQRAYGRFLFTHFTVPSRGPRQALSLSNLRIAWDDNNNFDALHKWLLWATPTPTTIRSLRIRSSHLEKMLPQFRRYLPIEFLNIVWYPESAEMDKRFSFGADFLPSLKTLVISAALPAHASGYCQFFSRSSPSPTLECVRIWFYVSDYDVEGQRGYSDLDATLSQLSAHVRIEIEDKHWEYLPKLKSKGVLVVSLVPYIE
ncbi:hypothetical protein ABKN59_011323 [Abortiporus biennis]